MTICRALICLALSLFAISARAEQWCDLAAGGYELVTHGNKSDEVYLLAQLPGAASIIWIRIANATVGKSNVALILAAQMAGKGLFIYLDGPSATCATYPSWEPMGGPRHIRILQ